MALTALYFLAGLALLRQATAPHAEGSATNGGVPAAENSQPVSQQDATSAAQPLAWPRWQRAYVYGLVPLELYCTFGHRLLCGAVYKDSGRLPFLPLLLTSVYCGVGVVAAWFSMTARYVWQLLADGAHRHQD